MDDGAAALDQIFSANPNLRLGARVASNHTQVLRRDSSAIANAVRDLAGASVSASDERT